MSKTIQIRTGVATMFATWCVVIAVGPAAQAAPDVPELTDQAISDAIDDELILDPGVHSIRIDVSTVDGIVTLSGTVDNLLASDRATRVAEAVKGVRAVVNQIAVEPPSRTNQQIRSDVETALLHDPATDSYEIDVSVSDGTVTLSGAVESFQERELVATVVKGVRGVKAIDDQIEVDYAAGERLDSEIAAEIAAALRWDVYVDHVLIDVDVERAQVTLSGTVGSAAEKRHAIADAWVLGVENVDASSLEVEDWARDERRRGDKYVVRSDEALQQAVADALAYDPRVMSFNVEVDAVGRTVTLRGTVDNLKAKRAAERTARNTVGVGAVENRLRVRGETAREDVEVAESIRSALMRDPYVNRFDVHVSVFDGTAWLSGAVDSSYERARAEDVASRVAGVLDVQNRVAVEDMVYPYDPYVFDDTYIDPDETFRYEPRAPLKTDAAIEDDIEDELWWSPFVDSDDVTVTVDDGVATLEGTVESWQERQAATANAYEGGATLVDNDLVIDTDVG